MVTVRRDLAQDRPDVVRELMRLFREAKAAAAPSPGARDPLVSGKTALQPAMRLAVRYSVEQGLLPRNLKIEDVWEGLPAAFEQELC